MFLLFVSTSDVEQIGLQLSPESRWCHCHSFEKLGFIKRLQT